MKNIVLSLIVASGLASAAQASLIGPGGSLFFAPGEADPVGGTVIASVTNPFATALYTGTLTTLVISGDTSNTLGGLTFVYIVHNNSTSQNGLARLTVNGYSGFTVDASYQAPASGTTPYIIDRQGTGDVMGWGFANLGFGGYTLITPGSTSAVLVAQTNAPSYQLNIANIIDGAVTAVNTFSPAVPTPGASALLALGMAASARRRRA